ncbi:MAG: hypothetical protein LBH32_10450 [Dysgonamonadaceae bacterium]|jgi:hypothetical protein|nr:hypothetical protein [Dysgonamonadaceae bacterium]
MKNTILTFVILLLFTSCEKFSNKREDNIIISSKEIKFNDEIYKFISGFIHDRNDANCIYELYLDKKNSDEYFITVFNLPNDSNYFATHFPVNHTIVDGHVIFVYSGIEDFIKKEDYFSIFTIVSNNSKAETTYETLSKVIKRDTSYIVGAIGLPFNDVKFLPPVSVMDE